VTTPTATDGREVTRKAGGAANADKLARQGGS
jgi:hypothetical protein